jgi:DNA polymerase delta subunit 2
MIAAPEDVENVVRGTFSKINLNNFVYKNLLNVYTETDQFLEMLCSTICVDLLPGLDDISNSVFPQAPVNKVLLEKGLATKNLNLVPNPYIFNLDNINILATSGQNISSLQKVTSIGDPLEIMRKTLEWAHIAPSAPDTLRTFPVSKEDPLIISQIPNVYVIGNQKEFQTKLIRSNKKENITRLISVPEFYRTNSIVLLDVVSLDVFEFKLEYLFN